MHKTGKYLVCVDHSDASRVAVRYACKKAMRKGERVELLHVITVEEAHGMFGVMDKMREEQRAEGEILLKSYAESAFQYAGLTPSAQLREGRAGEEILGAALEGSDINMLVLGVSAATARRGLVNWLAERLGDRLLVPLMLVPGNLTDLQIEELS
jgi:nucleotide-binding universal stress UspA family protein